MEIKDAREIKNMLNTVFDIVSADNFCPGIRCEDCPLKPKTGPCIPNKIQAQAKKGIQELASFIEANDKCSNQEQETGGEPA